MFCGEPRYVNVDNCRAVWIGACCPEARQPPFRAVRKAGLLATAGLAIEPLACTSGSGTHLALGVGRARVAWGDQACRSRQLRGRPRAVIQEVQR